MKTTIILVAIVLVSGCATATPNITPQLTVVDIPGINEKNTVEIGATLVQKAKVFEYDAYELLTEYVFVGTGYFVGMKYTASPGYYVAISENKKWRTFVDADGEFEVCALGLCQILQGGFMISKETGEVKIYVHMQQPPKIKDKPNWRKTKYVATDEPSVRRELIYNGRSGNTIRILYREFNKDMARPAFSQELTYDLSDGNTIGFQGVRIEILDTTNIDITYKVLSGFPDWEAIG